MQVIFRDFKNAERRLTAFASGEDSREEVQDPKLAKMLSLINLKLHALDDELENDFDTIVPPHTTASLHK